MVLKITRKAETTGTVRYVDVTPTWRGVVPIIEAALRNGTHKGVAAGREEMYRMADAADKWNAHVDAMQKAKKALSPDENIGSVKP